MEDMQEILEDFLVEAFELVEQIDHDLVELETNPEDLELLNRIFRVAHTVKGSSSFLNFDVLTKLTSYGRCFKQSKTWRIKNHSRYYGCCFRIHR